MGSAHRECLFPENTPWASLREIPRRRVPPVFYPPELTSAGAQPGGPRTVPCGACTQRPPVRPHPVGPTRVPMWLIHRCFLQEGAGGFLRPTLPRWAPAHIPPRGISTHKGPAPWGGGGSPRGAGRWGRAGTATSRRPGASGAGTRGRRRCRPRRTAPTPPRSCWLRAEGRLARGEARGQGPHPLLRVPGTPRAETPSPSPLWAVRPLPLGPGAAWRPRGLHAGGGSGGDTHRWS